MRAARLFHAIVVVGTGLGSACGGRAASQSEEANVGGTGAGGASSVTRPSDCRYLAQFRCDSYQPFSHCRCDPSLPEDAAACGGPSKFLCAQVVCAEGLCLDGAPNADCRCLPDAPTLPSDCPGGPGQFECSAYLPEFQGCHCNGARPGNPTDCSPTDSFECAAYAPSYYACRCDQDLETETACNDTKYCHYTCESQTPRYGCQCACTVPIA